MEPTSSPPKPWPRPLSALLLLVGVGGQAALWIVGFLALFQDDLPAAGTWLTWALVVLLFFGWLWRWLVAQGRIGGRPTVRFGGSGTD